MSADGRRRRDLPMDDDLDLPEDRSPDRVDYDAPDDRATGGSDSDEEIEGEMQQLQLVESPNGSGINIRGDKVSDSESSITDDDSSIIPATQKPSNNAYHSADETTPSPILGTGARPKIPLSVKKPKEYSFTPTPTTTRVRSTNRNLDVNTKQDQQFNTRSIEPFLLRKEKKNSKKHSHNHIPNVIDWFSNPNTGTPTPANKTGASAPTQEPKPQREPERKSKRKRIYTGDTDTNGHSHGNTMPNSYSQAVLNTEPHTEQPNSVNKSGNPQPTDYDKVSKSDHNTVNTVADCASTKGNNNDEGASERTGSINSILRNSQPTNAVSTNHCNEDTTQNSKDSNANRSHVAFQDEQDQFLPMNNNAVPFYKRARGCFCAESKAQERAASLDSMADNGKPPRWAFQMAPYPNYMGAISHLIVDIRNRHALEMTREVARALRTSSQQAAEQGRLNWSTVVQSYVRDTANADRAQSRLQAMASKERERERSRLQTRTSFHSDNPVLDTEIRRHLNGENVPVPTQNRGADNDDNAVQGASQAPEQPQGNNPRDNRAALPERNSRPNNRNNSMPRNRRANNRGPPNRSRSRSPRNGRRPRSRGNSRNRAYNSQPNRG